MFTPKAGINVPGMAFATANAPAKCHVFVRETFPVTLDGPSFQHSLVP
jgi:hypothetical protein